MTSLTFPFTEAQVRALKFGDEVSISGIVFTGLGGRREPVVETDAALWDK